MVKKDNFLSDIYWAEKIKINLEKNAVQSRRNDQYLFNNDKIYSVIRSKKPKYSSVPEAVKEMMERSGLTSYLQNQQNIKLSKKANTNIKLFNEFPQAQVTLDNIIESMGGYSAISAVISKLKNIHSMDIKDHSLFEDENLLSYIAKKNMEEKSKNPKPQDNSLLGKIHHESDESENNESILFDK